MGRDKAAGDSRNNAVVAKTPASSTPKPASNSSLMATPQRNSTPQASRLLGFRAQKDVEAFESPVVTSRRTSNAIDAPRVERSFTATSDDVIGPSFKDGSSEWPPKDPSYFFLQPEKIRDKDGRKPSDPDYDPTSLFVPMSFINKQTDAQKQWWQTKTNHFDKILFFKVGKFYEFYHMDALVGIEHLNLTKMSGSLLHCGFPEKSCQKYLDILREKGFKVARVEQTESNEARDRRRAKSGGDKVVNREVCQVTTPGTSRTADLDSGASSKFLLAICQGEQQSATDGFTFGVCFIDTAIGCEYYVDHFSLCHILTNFFS